MATGSALNLSLLSRGVGEVKRNGTEKVDVIFEPQDYFNFVENAQERTFFLPPLQPRYAFSHEPSQISSRFTAGSKDAVHLPKTFTTRKGALLLFSEDMAHRTKHSESKKAKSLGVHSSHHEITMSSITAASEDRDLKTVDDLAKSILSYGSFDDGGRVNLKFIQQKRRYDYDRQIRPGFSAKRYLSTWTKTWDDTVLEKVISKGYLTEKSLFYYNPLLPHLSRRLNDDLSHYPTPYKLMRSMLMSPGSLSGYTFYRVRPESQETDYMDIEEEEDSQSRKVVAAGSVKVASLTADGQLKETLYEELDQKAKREVLTDLLVKGAVHYAMEKQQIYKSKIVELDDEASETKEIPKFDMKDAVESMLHANEQKGVQSQVLDANLPERDDRSQQSGSFKGGRLGNHLRGQHAREHGVTWQDDASSVSSGGAPVLPTAIAPLPPIGQTHTALTTIGEVSREHTQAYVAPSEVKDQEDEDEDSQWAGHRIRERPVEGSLSHRKSVDNQRRDSSKPKGPRVSARSLDLEGQVIGGQGLMSSSESLGPGSTHSSGLLPTLHKQPWKGSTQSLRSHGSRKASGSQVEPVDVGSTKGSVIYGPDGSVIKVGETMKLSARDSVQGVHEVQDPHLTAQGIIDASDDSDAEVPDEWKSRQRPHSAGKPRSESIKRGRETPRSNVTEQDILDKLTTHATHIAESVLSQDDSGQVLEDDIRKAATLWMETHPARVISRSQSVQDLPDKTVIQEVMRGQKRNSAGPTVAEYRDQIKGNLLTALAKKTGLNLSELPADAEIDPNLLDQLANDSLAPEDIEIVHDKESGRSFIRSRNRMIQDAMGGVEKGHIYQSGKNGDGKRSSIPVGKPADIGELDIVHYGEEKSDKSPSEVGSKKAPSTHGAKSSKSGAGSTTGRSGVSGDALGDGQKALADLEQQVVSPSGKKSEGDIQSLKSGKSEGKKSKVSDKKAPSPEKKDDFVVGAQVDHTKENTKLYGMGSTGGPKTDKPKGKPKAKKPAKAAPAKKPAEKGKKGKGKAVKKKEEEPAKEPETVVETVSPRKEPSPEPPPKPDSAASDRTESMKQAVSDDDEEYIIVRDETMSPEVQTTTALNKTESFHEEEPDDEQMSVNEMETEDMSEADKLRMISNREARNAKRAAAAEKRRQDVERKRREREEQIKREKEEHERQEQLKQELEETRKRKEEERRMKAQQEEAEQEAHMKEQLERERREKAEQEKERRRKEEYARKLEEMKKKQAEEEKRRQEEAEQRRLEEEERKKQEAEMMAAMEEQERLEYERRKAAEEEERRRQEEIDKRKREEEAQRALEEARRLAEEMARRQAELEARLRFNRSLQLEASGLDHSQDITKAFVFSYFELLQWLGLDIPEFELLKLNQY